MKKLLIMFLTVAIILTMFVPLGYAADLVDADITIMTMDSISGANITGNIAAKKLDVVAQKFSLSHKTSGEFEICMTLEETPIVFDVYMGYANDSGTWLAGYAQKDSGHYSLTNFKIDKKAVSAMLMKPNQSLANTPVLSIEVDSQDGSMFYFQLPIENNALKLIDQFCSIDTYSLDTVDYRDLYMMYLTNHKPESVTLESTVSIDATESNDTPTTRASVKPILDAFPQYIFTGAADYATHVAQYGDYDYAYYRARFVGTTNVLTEFIGLRKTFQKNYSTQTFTVDYVLEYNTAVIYNPDSKDLSVYADMNNYFKVNSPTAVFNCSNEKGCIIKREQYAYIGTSKLSNITRAALLWVKYVPKVISTLETLTASSANTTQTYGTGYQNQLDIYGQVIQQISITSKTFKSTGDHVVMTLTGSNITSASATYSFDTAF